MRRKTPSSALAALVLLAGVSAAAAQREDRGSEEEFERPPTIFDLDYQVEDPDDLFPAERDFQNRWRRIRGALGMRYHLYPSRQTGPDTWPPHLYSGGMNYSIWRNPVTGWLEF